MEKCVATYVLENVKGAFSDPKALGTRMTLSVLRSAQGLGLSIEDIIQVIQSLTMKNFYKSMTSYANHKIWQDVYHIKYKDRIIYIKFTAKETDDYLLISFKEK